MRSSRREPTAVVVSSWSIPDSLPAGECGQNRVRVRHPAENAALGPDHLKSDTLKLGKVGADAVLEDAAVVAAIVGFPNGGVHAHFRRHAGDEQLGNAAVLQDGVQI